MIQDGTHTLEVYGSDLMPLNLGTKLGSQRAYGIVGFGIDPFRELVRWSYGAGLGVHFPLPLRRFYFDLDFMVHSVQPDIKLFDTSVYHVLSELRLLVGFRRCPSWRCLSGRRYMSRRPMIRAVTGRCRSSMPRSGCGQARWQCASGRD